MSEEKPPLTEAQAVALLAMEPKDGPAVYLTDEQARILVDHHISAEENALKISADYGKWTIGTILAYCGAIAIASRPALVETSVSLCLIFAFCFITIAGATAWANWNLVSQYWAVRTSRLLSRIAGRWKPPKQSRYINVTYWVCVACSVIAFSFATAALIIAASSGHLTPAHESSGAAA